MACTRKIDWTAKQDKDWLDENLAAQVEAMPMTVEPRPEVPLNFGGQRS